MRCSSRSHRGEIVERARQEQYIRRVLVSYRKTPGTTGNTQNALRHGLTAKHVVIREDDREEFTILQDALAAELDPPGRGSHMSEADQHDLGDDFFAHGGEESLKGLDGSFFALPLPEERAAIRTIYTAGTMFREDCADNDALRVYFR